MERLHIIAAVSVSSIEHFEFIFPIIVLEVIYLYSQRRGKIVIKSGHLASDVFAPCKLIFVMRLPGCDLVLT